MLLAVSKKKANTAMVMVKHLGFKREAVTWQQKDLSDKTLVWTVIRSPHEE